MVRDTLINSQDNIALFGESQVGLGVTPHGGVAGKHGLVGLRTVENEVCEVLALATSPHGTVPTTERAVAIGNHVIEEARRPTTATTAIAGHLPDRREGATVTRPVLNDTVGVGVVGKVVPVTGAVGTDPLVAPAAVTRMQGVERLQHDSAPVVVGQPGLALLGEQPEHDEAQDQQRKQSSHATSLVLSDVKRPERHKHKTSGRNYNIFSLYTKRNP